MPLYSTCQPGCIAKVLATHQGYGAPALRQQLWKWIGISKHFCAAPSACRAPCGRSAGAPEARRSTARRDFRWCWTGVSGWGRVAPQGCPGGTASGRATWEGWRTAWSLACRVGTQSPACWSTPALGPRAACDCADFTGIGSMRTWDAAGVAAPARGWLRRHRLMFLL